MPFGLTNALAMFQWMMDWIADVKGVWAWVHIDDLLIYSSSWLDHLDQIEETLQHLRKEGIMLKISKCELAKVEMEYLGHMVLNEGISPIPSHLELVVRCLAPKNQKEL